MNSGFTPINLAPLGFALLIGGCSSVNLWPFGDDRNVVNTPRVPANATEYRCEGNKTFHVRYLEGGKAWVIFADRQVSLDKVTAESGSRYSNGIAVLQINGPDVSLTDGPAIAYQGCKTPVAGGKP
jgi:membrane-bound inhibitor of C-type lysozyme